MKSPFGALTFPLGLAAAIAAGLFFPEIGLGLTDLRLLGASPRVLAVIGIFLVTGLLLEPSGLTAGKKFPAGAVAAVAINLLCAPLLGAWLGRAFNLQAPVLAAFLVFACVPTTLSSSAVITRTAGGNVTWALSLIILLSLVGIVVMPFSLSQTLASGGIVVDRGTILKNVFFLVMLPTGIGFALKKTLGHPRGKAWPHIPPALVVFIVWLSVSEARARLGAITPGAAVGAGALAGGFHLCLLALAAAAAAALRLGRREARALWFTGSQKSLPVTVSVLLLLERGKDPGSPIFDTATAAAVILYFPQIIIDSLAAAAARLKR